MNKKKKAKLGIVPWLSTSQTMEIHDCLLDLRNRSKHRKRKKPTQKGKESS